MKKPTLSMTQLFASKDTNWELEESNNSGEMAESSEKRKNILKPLNQMKAILKDTLDQKIP